ncbi:MAG: VRR-NUC domain-containing protein [Sneathiella sp.]
MSETLSAAEYRDLVGVKQGGGPSKKKNEHPEDDMQETFVELLGYQYPKLVFFAIPNGGKRDATTAWVLAKTGTRKGVADLCFLWPRGQGRGPTGYIEFKVDNNKQSPDQELFEADCIERDVPYAVCWSIEEALAFLKEWGAI